MSMLVLELIGWEENGELARKMRFGGIDQWDSSESDSRSCIRVSMVMMGEKMRFIKKHPEPLYLIESLKVAEQSTTTNPNFIAVSACFQLRTAICWHMESLGSKFALGGVCVVRRIAVESAIACAIRGYFAARRDEDGKADIRADPDIVRGSCSPRSCAQTVMQRFRGYIGIETSLAVSQAARTLSCF